MNLLFLKKMDRVFGPLLVRVFPRPAGGKPELGTDSRILLVRPGGIGDAVLLIPAVRALRRARPEAVIDVLAENRNGAVFALCPEVNEVLRYDRPGELRRVLGRSYDLIVDTEQWHRLSVLLVRLMRARFRLGFATNERCRLLSLGIDYSQDDYEAHSFLNLLRPLGIAVEEELRCPFAVVPEAVRNVAATLLPGRGSGPRVAIFPGASVPERRWGTESFSALAGQLAARGAAITVVGGSDDRAAGALVAEAGRGLNLCGRTSLVESAAVLERCDLLVSGDSGILHLAVGLGVPTVSLFGPGRAAKWAPRGKRHIVLNKELPCSPCTTFGYTPPCPHEARCLREITVAEVVGAVQELLGNSLDEKDPSGASLAPSTPQPPGN